MAVTCSISMFLWRPSHPSLFDYWSVNHRPSMGITHSWSVWDEGERYTIWTSEFFTALHLTLVCPYKCVSVCFFWNSYLSCTWFLVILAVGCNGLVHDSGQWQREGMARSKMDALQILLWDTDPDDNDHQWRFCSCPMDVSDRWSKIQNFRMKVQEWTIESSCGQIEFSKTHDFCGNMSRVCQMSQRHQNLMWSISEKPVGLIKEWQLFIDSGLTCIFGILLGCQELSSSTTLTIQQATIQRSPPLPCNTATPFFLSPSFRDSQRFHRNLAKRWDGETIKGGDWHGENDGFWVVWYKQDPCIGFFCG